MNTWQLTARNGNARKNHQRVPTWNKFKLHLEYNYNILGTFSTFFSSFQHLHLTFAHVFGIIGIVEEVARDYGNSST